MSFSIDNIPYGVASTPSKAPQCVTRHIDTVIFLGALQEHGVFNDVEGLPQGIFNKPTLNAFASLSKPIHHAVRSTIQDLLRCPEDEEGDLTNLPVGSYAPLSACKLHVPVTIGGFTDFSISKHHNTRAGEIVLGMSTLPPVFYHYPIGYTGRSSSIFVSGTPIQRPVGMMRDPKDGSKFVFGPSAKMDFELELGCVVGRPVEAGRGCSTEEAEDHIFGFVLINDWSARDIQALEMVPLGPLNGKSFGTTISPWIVTSEALKPFKISAPPFEKPPAPYLQSPSQVDCDQPRTMYNINFRVDILTGHGDLEASSLSLAAAAAAAPAGATKTTRTTTTIASPSLPHSVYYTFPDLLAHQTINGCPLVTGDLLATGTISGEGDHEKGCLLEGTYGGKRPIQLLDGSALGYLEDWHGIRIEAWAEREAGGAGEAVSIGFGGCEGVVVPAREWKH